MKYTPINPGRWLVWSLYALALIIAPMLFHKGASLSILSQMGTVMIFGLAYNMLLGQGGMLSFGHAVYSGLGAFIAIHAMNLIATAKLPIPVSLIPLVGGIGGMFFGVLFGYVTTKKAGTTFAMITLGIVELVAASSLMFTGFFGGEGGISTNRVIGDTVMGISYGPQIQVYYLIAFWLFISTIGMYAFTQTPLGRIINAVRDNPERAEFIGYNPQRVRYLTFILSAFFSGIAGGLAAINFEIVSWENVSAARSGAILLFTFIGGIGFFFGPLIGAVVGVFLTAVLSEFTKAWLLYLGTFFILMVRYAPGGMAGLIMLNLRVARFGKFKRIFPSLAAVCAAATGMFSGSVIFIEMLYHRTLDSANGTEIKLFGFLADTATSSGWLVAAALFAVGAIGFRMTKKSFQQVWGEVNSDFEESMRKAAA